MADRNIYWIDKVVAAKTTESVDFANDIPDSVTISSSTLSVVKVPTLTSVTATDFLTAATGTTSGTQVQFTMKDAYGVAGELYKITMIATLSDGEKLVAVVYVTLR